MNVLVPLLTPFVPLATHWAAQQESIVLSRGRPLTPKQVDDARKAGVAHPEKIRIQEVRSINPPKSFLLGLASKIAGGFDKDVAGMTLGYGIFIRKDCWNYRSNRNLYVHEFVHVGQYERYGSIQAFLVDYLRECIDPGYPRGPLEKQANRVAAKIVREG